MAAGAPFLLCDAVGHRLIWCDGQDAIVAWDERRDDVVSWASRPRRGRVEWIAGRGESRNRDPLIVLADIH